MLAWLDRLARTSLIPGADRAWFAARRMASLVRVVGTSAGSSTMISLFTLVYPGVIRGTFFRRLGFYPLPGVVGVGVGSCTRD